MTELNPALEPQINVQKLIASRNTFFRYFGPEAALQGGRLGQTEKVWLSLLGSTSLYWEGFSCLVGYFENQRNPPLFNQESLQTYIRENELHLDCNSSAVAAAGWALTRILPVEIFGSLAPQMGSLERCLADCLKEPDPPSCFEDRCL